MLPLWLDYQRPPPGRQRPGLLLLGAGIAVTAILLIHYSRLTGQTAAMEAEVAQLRRTAALQTPSAPTSGLPSGELDYSAARWEALFHSLEAASDESMTLLGLQPGADEVQISGEAKNVAATMEYLKRLQGESTFATVHLTQSEIVTTHPQRPVRFTVVAQWRKGER